MNSTPPIQSIAAAGEEFGRRIEQQLEVAFRRLMHGPCVFRAGRFARLITGEDHPLGNFAILHESDDVGISQVAMEPLLRAAKPAAAIFTGGSVSAQVTDFLQQQGFQHYEDMTAMAVELDQLVSTKLPAGYEFERLDEARSAGEWAEAMADGFEFPLAVAKAFVPERASDDVHCFAVRKDGRIVSTSLLFLADGFAGVYCVSTIPGERGRGLGAHATAQSLRSAREQGFRVGILQATEMGKPVYRRLGFAEFGGVPVFTRTP